MPPFLEMAARPLYEAAVACNDPGKLCPEGFVLFDEWSRGLEQCQAEFWAAYARLNGAFSSKHKADKELTYFADGAGY